MSQGPGVPVAFDVEAPGLTSRSRPGLRRVLLIAYAYPPHPPPGANRLAAMSAHLEAMGHEVAVLTTSAFGSDGPARRETVRAPDALGLPGLRGMLLPPGIGADLDAGASAEHRARARARGLVRRVAVPDIRAVTWAPAAAPGVCSPGGASTAW
jgi:LmbE family N-acetylglucosaminyl deacetylase